MLPPSNVFVFYIKNFWRYCGIVIVLYSVLAIIDTLGVNLLPAFALKETVAAIENTPADMAFDAVLSVALMYALLRFCHWCSSILRWYVFDNFIKYRSYNKISSDLYNYVFGQSVDYYSATMPGKISSQIHQISETFFETVELIFGTAMGILVTFAISASGLLVIGWQYLAIITFAVLFRFFWGVFTVRRSLKKAAQTSATLNTLQGRLLDALSNFTVVKLFARAKYEQEFVAPVRKKYQKDACVAHFWSRFFWAPGNLVMDTICFSAFIIASGYLYSAGHSSVADISFAIAIYIAISNIAFNVVMMIKNFTSKWGGAVGSYNSLIRPVAIRDYKNAKNLRVTRGEIKILNLSFRYNKNFVIRDLSLTIRPSEKVGLVGLSGAGKSTLVNLLMRLYDATQGKILIDGQNIRHVFQDSLREKISFIPQEPTMFNRTLRENIAYGKQGATDEEIMDAAISASAHEFIMGTSNGYDTTVGDRGIKLSGGQRQRIAIARAFLKDAPILILDEATAALDSETEFAIQNSFEKLASGRTTVVIAHRLSTLKNMDRIIVLEDGMIKESGKHSELLKNNGVYARLWRMQSCGFIQE